MQAFLVRELPSWALWLSQSLLEAALRLQKSIEPDVRWTILYVVILGVAYLFHSPFRSHNEAALDTYARLTKIIQTWSLITLFCFHIAPRVIREKTEQLQAYTSANPDAEVAITLVDHANLAGIVFFPVFSSMTCLFLLLHKMKRRWGMIVTYGSSLTMVLINSLLMAVLAIMHHAYSRRLFVAGEGMSLSQLRAGETRSALTVATRLYSVVLHRVVGRFIATPSTAEHPFTVFFKLGLLCGLFILADYLYKRRQGGDPTRGILWADVYDYQKRGPAHVRQAQAGLELRGPPRSWRQWVRALLPAAAQPPPDWRELVPKPVSFRHKARPGHQVGSPTRSVTRKLLPSRTPSFPHGLARAPLLYNEDPESLPWVDAAWAVDGGVARSPTTSAPPGGSLLNASFFSASGHSPAPSADLTRTWISFRERRARVSVVAEARHPENKPGMVPWWSTFSIGTAWQSFVGSSLKFMSFDVRTIQSISRPKIFSLRFVPRLEYIYGADGARTAPFALLTKVVPGGEDAGSDPQSASDGDLSRLAVNAEGIAAPAVDVWFDWIADVGDGFNPTYEMARLLAQPLLYIGSGTRSAKKSLGRNYLSAGDAGARGGLANERLACEIFPASALTESDPYPGAVFAVTAAEAASEPRRPSAPLVGRTAAEEERSGGGLGSGTAPGSPTLRRAASTDLLLWGDASPRGSASPATPGAVPRHRRNSLADAVLGTAEVLPRGSFVLVGGDLAYPLPTDETYATRLFDPYTDAMASSVEMKKLFHSQQRNLVRADPLDDDVAHIVMLDAASVARKVVRGCTDLGGFRGADWGKGGDGYDSDDDASDDAAASERKGRGGSRAARAGLSVRVTAAEALHSTPMLFAIPGNHDWFDGLSTFRKWIVEKTWIGGWFMPQRSSFFMLKLPYNWFILGMDTGSEQDIDTAQRNYFLACINRYMNEESCVILTCHEPGWLFNAMEHRSSPLQPEIDAVVRHLGTRMRLRLAGDIHNYSRHVPIDPLSEAATLIVSGGGGAYMYGARDDQVIEQGTRYMRAGAFPRANTYMGMASRLWGFRVVNWKFDVIIGVCCFGIIYSILPIPAAKVREVMAASERACAAASAGSSNADALRILRFLYAVLSLSVDLGCYLANNGIASLLPISMFYAAFGSAGADRHASGLLRLVYGGFWTGCVVACCCTAVAYLYVLIEVLQREEMIASTPTQLNSFLERELRASTDAFWSHARVMLGEEWVVSHLIGAVQQYLYGSGQWIVQLVSFAARALDPLETLYYLSAQVAGGMDQYGQFATDTTRLHIAAYYACLLCFYWVIVTPLVSLIIGIFLMVSATVFDFMYDGSYSAFQIEDFKHFLRFRIDARTRQLHGYVIAEKTVPRVWEQNKAHVHELSAGERRSAPPHLRLHPSRWVPALTKAERARQRATAKVLGSPVTQADVLEHFVISPHRTSATGSSSASL